MDIAVPKEVHLGENRVALIPEHVAKLVEMGAHITVETGIGQKLNFSDEDYAKAGASLEADRINLLQTADMVLRIRKPGLEEIASSPIYGMPVINADKAKTVLALRRSMATGFAGVENPLFIKQNTRMLFGDAKASLQQLVSEFKEAWQPETGCQASGFRFRVSGVRICRADT